MITLHSKAFPNRFQHGTRCTWPQANLHANSAISNVTANQDVIVQVSISGLYMKLVKKINKKRHMKENILPQKLYADSPSWNI